MGRSVDDCRVMGQWIMQKLRAPFAWMLPQRDVIRVWIWLGLSASATGGIIRRGYALLTLVRIRSIACVLVG